MSLVLLFLPSTPPSTTVPTVTTNSVSSLNAISENAYGTVTNNGGATIIRAGFVIAKHSTPTINDTVFDVSLPVTTGSSLYQILNNLASGKTYYVRAFATNSVGTGYGNELSFSTISASIIPAVKKRYYYKIYDINYKYITTWSTDVISDPKFRRVVNGGASELNIRLARQFNNFGEGVDVSLKNRIECWVSDLEAPSGRRIFTGYVSQYSPTIDDEDNYIDVTVLGYVTETSYRILKDSSNNTTITYTSQDPAAILRDAIDKYRADGGVYLSYTASSIQNTNTLATYTFKHNTINEVFDKVIELCPSGWFWYVDTDGVIYLKQPNLALADHVLTVGKNIAHLEAPKRIENLVNQVFVVGGGNPNLFNEYSRSSSQESWGKFEKKIQDGKVTDNDTADLLAKRTLDYYQSPETRLLVTVVDSNGENTQQGVDIENFQVGDTLQVKNLYYGSTMQTLWDKAVWDTDVWDAPLAFTSATVLIIVSINYYKDYIEIEASSRLPELSKRIEDVNENVNTLMQVNLPTTPTQRTV